VLVGFAALRFLKSAGPVPSETQISRNLREHREG
jgi:hypothetical protein